MTDAPTPTKPAPAPGRRRGKTVNVKRREVAAQAIVTANAAAQEAVAAANVTNYGRYGYPNKNLPPPPPARSFAERHRLRPVEEYPADDMADSRFHIPRDQYPTGYDLQWVAISVWEQPMPAFEAAFARKGWEGVYPEDFDGKYADRVPRSWQGPIVVDGLMLVARSMEWSKRAMAIAKREAEMRVNIKVHQLNKGELDQVTLNPQHKHLDKTNYVNISNETIQLPPPTK